MSAGKFEQGVYESDSGDYHVCRYQPETTAATLGGVANTIAAFPPSSVFWVKLTKGAREYGLAVRKVRLRWTGPAPTGYKADTTFEIPVMTPSVFATCILNGGAIYLGEACQIIGKTYEKMYPAI
jgi:hypothetical protein